MRVCPKCGHIQAEQNRFCQNCGSPLTFEEEHRMHNKPPEQRGAEGERGHTLNGSSAYQYKSKKRPVLPLVLIVGLIAIVVGIVVAVTSGKSGGSDSGDRAIIPSPEQTAGAESTKTVEDPEETPADLAETLTGEEAELYASVARAYTVSAGDWFYGDFDEDGAKEAFFLVLDGENRSGDHLHSLMLADSEGNMTTVEERVPIYSGGLISSEDCMLLAVMGETRLWGVYGVHEGQVKMAAFGTYDYPCSLWQEESTGVIYGSDGSGTRDYEVVFDSMEFVFLDADSVIIDDDESQEEGIVRYLQGEPITSGDYVLEYSSDRLYSATELEGYSQLQLRVARNEIYARHGRLFSDKALQDYFEEFDWYYGYISGEDFSEELLTAVERANVQLIREAENKAEG